MNEDTPPREFLTGCAIGFGLILLFLIGLLVGGLFLIPVLGQPKTTTAEAMFGVFFSIALAGLGIYSGVLLIKKTVCAFRDKRTYYGMGMLAVILVPLLFFGVCTMMIA